MRTTGSRFQTPLLPRTGRQRIADIATTPAKAKRPANGAPPAARNRRRTVKTTAPLYLQVANQLIDGIQSGNFPVGSLLPTEVELAAIHKVSRQTVRHAIAELRHKGLVSARKGVGTRIESVKAARRFNYSAQSVADLFTIAAETEMTVQARTMIVARGKLAAQLGCRSGHRWLHLGCLRTIANERRPLCWTDIFVDGRLAPIVRTQSVFRSAVFALIEKEAGESVTEIQQEIRAIVLERSPCAADRGDARRAGARDHPPLFQHRPAIDPGLGQHAAVGPLLLFGRDPAAEGSVRPATRDL